MLSIAAATTLAAATYGASILHHHGHPWADQVCDAAGPVCAAPHWVALAAVVVVLVQLFRQSVHAA